MLYHGKQPFYLSMVPFQNAGQLKGLGHKESLWQHCAHKKEKDRSLKPLLALKLKDFVMILIKRVFLFMKLIPQKYLESETCMWGFSFLRVKKMWVEMQDIQQTDHWV